MLTYLYKYIFAYARFNYLDLFKTIETGIWCELNTCFAILNCCW